MPRSANHLSDPFGRAGDLHDDVRIKCRQRLAFTHHAVEIRGNDLRADISADDAADLHVMAVAGLRTADVLPGHERRVGRNAVEDTQFVGFANLIEIRRVDKEFHTMTAVFGWSIE